MASDADVIRLIQSEADNRVTQVARGAYDLGLREGREMNGETVICLDCLKRATPHCEWAGHGCVTLAELGESYSSPTGLPGDHSERMR